MFRVTIAFLLVASLQGTDQNDTDILNSLAGVKSDIQALKDLLKDCLRKQEPKLNRPLTENADCTWNRLKDPVVTNGILITGALTIEACKEACQRTSDCRYFDWIDYLQLCYLPVQPMALRYELNCSGSQTYKTTTSLVGRTDKADRTSEQQPITETITTNPQPLMTTPETDNQKQTTTSVLSPKPMTIPVCRTKLDLAFVVDGSTSICNGASPCENWDFNLQFIHRIVEGLIIGTDDSRVALVMFSNQAKVEWNLDEYTNKTMLLSAIVDLMYPAGKTNTTGALKTLVSKVFTPAAGDRPDVPNTAILITDGIPTVEPWLLPAAINAVQRSGIKMLVVGVTNSVYEKTVREMSSPPQKVNVTYFLAKDYSSIDLVRGELQKQTCTV